MWVEMCRSNTVPHFLTIHGVKRNEYKDMIQKTSLKLQNEEDGIKWSCYVKRRSPCGTRGRWGYSSMHS
jgi:hypothetical protein